MPDLTLAGAARMPYLTPMSDDPTPADPQTPDWLGGSDSPPPDPTRAARGPSKPALPKRFYTDVSVEPRDGAFVILLDGRPVRTPRQSTLALPTREAADLVAEEWRAQKDLIDLSTMPVTRLVNAAIDGVEKGAGIGHRVNGGKARHGSAQRGELFAHL